MSKASSPLSSSSSSPPLLLSEPTFLAAFAVLDDDGESFAAGTSGAAMLSSSFAIRRLPVLLNVSSRSCRVPRRVAEEMRRREDMVMLSIAMAWKAPICQDEVGSSER